MANDVEYDVSGMPIIDIENLDLASSYPMEEGPMPNKHHFSMRIIADDGDELLRFVFTEQATDFIRSFLNRHTELH